MLTHIPPGLMVNENGSETALYDMYSGLIIRYVGDEKAGQFDPVEYGLASLGDYWPMEIYTPGPKNLLAGGVIFNEDSDDGCFLLVFLPEKQGGYSLRKLFFSRRHSVISERWVFNRGGKTSACPTFWNFKYPAN